MKRLIIPFFVQIFVYSLLSAQGEYISRGMNGYGGGVVSRFNSEASAFGVQAGYSYHGFVDGTLLYIKSSSGDWKNGILSPSITYYIVKQEDAEHVPTIGLTLGYRHYTTSSTSTVIEPDSIPAITFHSKSILHTQTLDAAVLDIAAHKRVGYWKVYFFQPMIGGGVAMTHVAWTVSLRAGVDIGTRVVNGPLLVLTPGLEYQSHLSTFTLSLQAIF